MVLPLPLEMFFFVVTGLVLGSFSSFLMYRTSHDMTWFSLSRQFEGDGFSISPHQSVCPQCKHVLGFFDLFPLLSWILQRGHCRYCQASISIIYPLVEILSAIACIGIYLSYGFSVHAFILCLVVPFFIALIFVDISRLILPDSLVIAAFVIGLVFCAYRVVDHDSFLAILFSNVFGSVVFVFLAWGMSHITTRMIERDSLGFGDVKFFAVAGVFLGLQNLPLYLVVSGFIGVIFALLWKRVYKTDVFPFGPSLIISLYVLILFSGFQ